MRIPAIEPGLSGTSLGAVAAKDLATAHGSGTVDVFATPAMVALMEEAAVAALSDVLPSDLTTVGIHLDVRHVAATPLGMAVQATATVTEVDGRIVTFEVSANDAEEQIGHGTHRRAIVNSASFQSRADAKSPTT
jgi:fluoroacetyl-CoA thioesterase